MVTCRVRRFGDAATRRRSDAVTRGKTASRYAADQTCRKPICVAGALDRSALPVSMHPCLRLARTGSGKVPAIALAALCLLGPILSYAHMLLVAHARCPEHGELLHVEAPGAVQLGARTEAAGGLSVIGSAERLSSESHAHDHCVVASARKAETVLESAGAIAVIEPAGSPGGGDERRAGSAPVPLYVLAPKNSPPA